MASGEVGVTVTLREIYDNVTGLRKDVASLRSKVADIERQMKDTATPAYLKRAGYTLGLVAAGVAGGWGAVRGGG